MPLPRSLPRLSARRCPTVRRALLAALCCAQVLWLGTDPLHAQARRAFVIVTSDYEHLRNSALHVHSFREISGALREAGFDVIEAIEDRSSVIRAKFNRFARQISADDFVLFILAGHTLSGDRGVLYLPKEIEAANANEVFRRAIPNATFTRQAARGKNGVILMITTNPDVPAQFGQLVPFPSNLSEPPENVVVAFSGSRNIPLSQLDFAAERSVGKLLELISSGFEDGSKLAETVAGRGTGIVVGRLQPMRLPPRAAVPGAADGGRGDESVGPYAVATPPSGNLDEKREQFETETEPVSIDARTTSAAQNGAALPADNNQPPAPRDEAARTERETFAKLQAENATARDALAALQEELREREREAAAARQRARAAEQEIEAQKNENARLNDALAKLQTDRQNQQRARERAEETAAKARQEAENAEADARAAEASADAALEAKLAAEAEARREQEEKSKRAAELAERAAEAERLRRVAEEELAAARARAQSLSKDREDGAAAEKAREAAEMRAQETARRAREADDRAQAAEQQARASLNARLAAERAVREQNEQNARLADELARLKTVAEGARLQAERELAKALQLEEKLAKSEAERAAQQSARQEAESQAADAAAKARAAQERARAAEERLEELSADKAVAETRAKQLAAAEQQRQGVLEAAAKAAQLRLTETEAELERLRGSAQRLSKVEDQAKAEAEARQSAQKSADLSAARVQEAEKRVREAEAFAEQAAERVRDARSEAADNQRRLSEEVEALRNKLAAMEQAAEAKRAQEAEEAAERGALPPVPVPNTEPRAPRFELAALRRIEALFNRETKQRVQSLLIKKGYLAGQASGKFSPETRAAIAKFQTAIGAEATGYLTPVELRELFTK